LYLLFSRQPDYLDGEKTPAVIHWSYDSAAHRSIPKALFNTGLKNYAIDARYIFREWKDGDKLEVIYESGDAGKSRSIQDLGILDQVRENYQLL
jgi:hypothetical protein